MLARPLGALFALLAPLLAGCEVAFPLDGYGSGAGTGGGSSAAVASSSSSSSSGAGATPHLYVFGGLSGAPGVGTDKVFAAPIATDGSVGTFVTLATPMAIALGDYGGVATPAGFYAVGGYDNTGAPSAAVEFGVLDAVTGAWNWSPLPGVIYKRVGRPAVVYGGHLFALGGITPGTGTGDEIVVAALANDGSLSGWTKSATALPVPLSRPATIVDGAGHLFVIGGADAGGMATSTVSMATLTAVGAISTFVNEAAFVGSRHSHCCVVRGGGIYLMGGENSMQFFFAIERALININSGHITPWTILQQPMPAVRRLLGCTVYGDRLYIAGGLDANDAPVASVHYASFLANGDLSAWTTASPLPAPICGASIVVR